MVPSNSIHIQLHIHTQVRLLADADAARRQVVASDESRSALEANLLPAWQAGMVASAGASTDLTSNMTEAIELVTQLISKVETIDMASLDAILKQTDANAEALLGSLAALEDEVNEQVGKFPSFLPRFTPISSKLSLKNATKRV